jgi:hypothetical protein
MAQEIEESDVQAWFQYEFQHRLKEKLRGSWDLGYRELISTEDALGGWSRLHTRGALLYTHSRRVSFEGGIGGYYTFSENLTDQLELRSWQGAIVFWPATNFWGRELDLRHRFRLEQRWINLRDLDETNFGLRLRYRLATFIPLNRAVIETKAWYLPVMGEAFADLGGDTPELFAARLRLSAGIGYVLSENWTLEFRYTAQKSRDTVSDRFTTTDNIFDLRIRTAVRIRDMVRSQN